MDSYSQGLQLYRRALRALKLLPLSHQTHFKSKMRYNFREIAEVLQTAPEEDFGRPFLARCLRDICTLERLFRDYANDVPILFPVFEPPPLHAPLGKAPPEKDAILQHKAD
jgi:hypothetical protein